MAQGSTGSGIEEEQAERIVVALDASPNSVAALHAAAELAALLDAELEGLFVEDINLLNLCGYPYRQEVGSFTGTVRRLDDRALQRQLRALAESMRRAMAREARRFPVRWRFRVRRGSVVTELLAASQSASMVSLGRTGGSRRKTLGSTTLSVMHQASRPVLILGEEGKLKSPLTVLYTGTESADRALRMAINLHFRNQSAIRVLVYSEQNDRDADEVRRRAEKIVRQADVSASVQAVAETRLRDLLKEETGTLVLPREYAALLSEHSGPAILVP